mmetsp:Transcript_21109/g.60236  ORF Transcript_21109/g.60236 Transcript_21109/m.60236 type:complete len:277 (+) Transcript_21109:598-1428(+)
MHMCNRAAVGRSNWSVEQKDAAARYSPEHLPSYVGGESTMVSLTALAVLFVLLPASAQDVALLASVTVLSLPLFDWHPVVLLPLPSSSSSLFAPAWSPVPLDAPATVFSAVVSTTNGTKEPSIPSSSPCDASDAPGLDLLLSAPNLLLEPRGGSMTSSSSLNMSSPPPYSSLSSLGGAVVPASGCGGDRPSLTVPEDGVSTKMDSVKPKLKYTIMSVSAMPSERCSSGTWTLGKPLSRPGPHDLPSISCAASTVRLPCTGMTRSAELHARRAGLSS